MSKAKEGRIFILRRIVAAGLLVAGIVLGCVSYFLLSASETQTGTQRYNSVANFAVDALYNDFDDKLNSVLTLAKAVQYGITNSTAWPNVYLPGFFDTVASQRDATRLNDMFIAPLVSPSQLPSYKVFLRDYIANEPRIPYGAGVPTFGVYGVNYNNQPIVYEELTGEAQSYESPNKIIVPITQFLFDRDFGARNFGFNMHSIAHFGRSLDAVMECSKVHNYSEAILVCKNISTIIPLPLFLPPSEITNFHSKLLQPVYLDFNSSQLVGFVGGGFDWRSVLASPFQTAREGIDVVLQNGEVSYTFTTTNTKDLRLKGYGDLHDRDYNDLCHEATLFTSFDGSPNAATYKIFIYPTKTYYQIFCTTTPIVTAAGCAILLLLCAGAFLLYDHYMQRANNACAMVLETKRRFVRFISHEIRTPLNAVHLGLEALTAEVGRAVDLLNSCLLNPELEPPDILQILRGWQDLSSELMGNSESAVDVLNDLLNYDKIEMGTLRLEFSAVPIWEIVRSATIGFLTPAKHKNVRLSLENGLDLDEGADEHNNNQYVVIGDHARLTQVMRNFISNAIKFTPVTGSIKIYVMRVVDSLPHPTLVLPPESVHLLDQPRAGSIRISVTDSGVGLTADQLAQICSEGVQFNANELQAGKGSGLGLFISKGIVEQHGGTLTVSSAGLGTGTTFTVELPLYHRIAKPTRKLPLKSHVAPAPQIHACTLTPTSQHHSFSHSLSHSLSFSATNVDCVELGKRILVVDDAASNRKMLIRILKAHGYVCEQAEDGQQALDRYVESIESHEPFYAIIMDFEMPGMNGPTATGHLRAMGCTVPILGVTGNLLPDDVTFFKSQGANKVLGKPLDLARFEEFMREHEEEREHSLNCTPVRVHGSFMTDNSLLHNVV